MTAKTLTPTDTEHRRQAQSIFDRPVAVEAGAGTGKTTVLVARVLGWTLGRGWQEAHAEAVAEHGESVPLDEIAAQVLGGLVAITFTEAAAAQMARQVAQALAKIATDPAQEVVGFCPELLPTSDPDTLKQRAHALIGNLDHLAVRTIHAHCFHLLSTYPLAAGLSPELAVDAEGRVLEEIVRDVVDPAVKAAYAGPPDHPLHRLALARVDPRQVAAAIAQLATEGFSSDRLEADPLSPVALTGVDKRLAAAVEPLVELVEPLTGQQRSKHDRDTALAVEQTAALLARTAEISDLATFDGLLQTLAEIWQDDPLKRLHEWGQGRLTGTLAKLVAEQARLSELSSRLAGLVDFLAKVDLERLDAGRRALKPLLAEVERELRARGVLTYSTLMTETWRLLAEHPAVRRREQRRLRQLLVDEFQDTDRLQCEIVRLLALEGGDGPRPGLFVVGDPKQSIYGWRDADLEAYESFLSDMKAAGGLALELSQNFRSVPAVLAEVDRAIAPVMTPLPGLQPAYSGLETCQRLADADGFDRAGRAPIEYWLSWTDAGAATRAEEAARLEAAAIAADIRQLHDQEGVAFSEFALLLRSTSRLETYLEAFRRQAVKFVVTSDKHYFRRREVIEAAALVRTILVPVDHLALLTFLRSATVGVPDAALLPLWRGRLPELVTRLAGPDDPELAELRSLLAAVADTLPTDIPGIDEIAGWHHSAAAALTHLAHLRRAWLSEPADRFIEQLRQRLLFDVTESARYLGVFRLANLDRFFRDFQTALEELGGDIQAVLRSLRRSVAEAEETEQALPAGVTDDAVQVMTIHGAKGLEFAHVYLPQLHARGRSDRWPTIAVDRSSIDEDQCEYVLFGSPTLGFDQIGQRRHQIERAERVRTLYVAMTRAKERLVLLGCWPESPVPVPTEKQATYLDLLQARDPLPRSISEALDRGDSGRDGFVDATAARWWCPRPGAVERPRSPAEQIGDADLSASAAAREASARLAQLRQAAEWHRRRPFSGSASAEAATRLAELDPIESAAADSEVARAVGDSFHRMLEAWDLDAEPDAELDRLREIQHRRLRQRLAGEQSPAASELLDCLLERFRDGRLLSRFLGLADSILGREVPVVLPPAREDDGPVGYVSGFIDLLCRDLATGRWLIIDYKTDHLDSPAEIEQRAQAYAAQETVYARAVQDSFALEEPPSTELWFIWPDARWQDGEIT